MLNFIKKKDKLSYRFRNEKLNDKDVAEELIKRILVKATPSSSCWWSKMKARTDTYKDNLDRVIQKQVNFIKTGEEYFTEDDNCTVRTCPGILGLFSETFLIKSPTDIVFTITNQGQYLFDIADDTIISITEHTQSQFIQDDNKLFENKVAIKFSIMLSIKTSGFPYILTDPTYHSNSGFYVPTGLVNSKYANNQQLNIITFIDIPKETKTIVIKEGDVIGYLIPFKKCSLSFSEENFRIKRFRQGFVIKKWFNK